MFKLKFLASFSAFTNTTFAQDHQGELFHDDFGLRTNPLPQNGESSQEIFAAAAAARSESDAQEELEEILRIGKSSKSRYAKNQRYRTLENFNFNFPRKQKQNQIRRKAMRVPAARQHYGN